MSKPAKSAALAKVESTRTAFSKAVQSYRSKHGPYIDSAPRLPQVKLNRCQVFADRLLMISSKLVPKSSVWVEVGVDKGLFSKEILHRTQPAKLHLIDINIARLDRSNVDASVRTGVTVLHEGPSVDLLGTFPDNYFDVAYIDADHFYDGVKNDIAAVYPKLKSNSLLLFNDYAAWSPGSMSRCGVAKAANEFISSHQCQVVGLALQGSGYYDLAVRISK